MWTRETAGQAHFPASYPDLKGASTERILNKIKRNCLPEAAALLASGAT